MPPVVPVEAEEANVENSSSPSTPSALDIDAVPFSPHSASNLPEQQSQNDVGSPVSSFHFPPNVPIDDVRLSSCERTPVYFSTLQAEKQAKANIVSI